MLSNSSSYRRLNVYSSGWNVNSFSDSTLCCCEHGNVCYCRCRPFDYVSGNMREKKILKSEKTQWMRRGCGCGWNDVEWMFWSVIRVKFKWISHRHKHSSARTLYFNINAIMKWKVLLFIFPQISFSKAKLNDHHNETSEWTSKLNEWIRVGQWTFFNRVKELCHSNRFQ